MPQGVLYARVGGAWVPIGGGGMVSGAGLDQATADARYVNIAGDTMTAALVLPGNPAAALEAAPKQYVDLMLPLTGGTLTGDLTIATPQALNFGQAVRQMLNLYATTYALGVQSTTLYQRSGGGFGWYKGGVHSATARDPG